MQLNQKVSIFFLILFLILLDISINSYKNTYRPTVINNIEIIKYQTDTLNINNFYELKENLLEHYDFAALPKKIYKLFKKWYDIDFEVIRYLRPDPTQNNKMVLELYPGTIISI